MQVSVAIHEIISWIVAAISIALFLYERRKNSLTPFYMNLQGLLKTCHAKAVFYFSVARHYESANKDEALKWQAVSSDFEALKQTVMGVMKAIEPDKDMPFDDRRSEELKEKNNDISKNI
jgi:hypothetical protein